MKIYKYSFQNIGPFSNVPTVVDLESPTAQMNMMIGENGIGKSTTIKALKFGLYHDLAYSGDITVDEIANDVNKNGEIIIELNSRGKDWTIVTNFSPNKIKVYEGRGESRGTEPLDKGGMPATKKFIREQVLDIPFYIFDNILSIDIAEFKSLLTLNAEDTRKIRDRIFGFSVFNEMSSTIKKRLNSLIEDRKVIDHDLEEMKVRHGQLLKEIEDMKEQVKSDLKVGDLHDKVKSLKDMKESGAKAHELLVGELAQASNDQKWFFNIENQAIIDRWTTERAETEKLVAKNINEQAEVDNKIQLLQEYSEVIALDKSIVEDKERLAQKNNDYVKIKADYDKLASEIKEMNTSLDVVNDHLQKKALEKKWLEYKGLEKQSNENNEWFEANVPKSKLLSDRNTEIKIQVAPLKRELEARQNGICHECNTKFHSASDPGHEKHMADLVQKIKAMEDEFNANVVKAQELLEEIDRRKSSVNTSRMAVLKSEVGDVNDTTDWTTQYKGEDAEKEMADLKKKVDEAKAKATKLKDDGTQLRGELISFKEKVVKDSERLKELKGKYTEQPSGNIDSLKELRTALVTKRNELHKTENACNVQVQVLEAKVNKDVKEPKYTEQEATSKLSELPKKIEESKASLVAIAQQIFEAEKSIEIANNVANLNLQSVHIKKQARELEASINEKVAGLGDIKSQIERQEHLLEVIKRSKDEVLRINIPYINHMVVNTCKRIGVTQNLTFDDSFVPHIYRGNREVSLMSASLGQRKKMNFAVLIAITKFLKLRYGGLNIIFYDEMFSSIDEKGRPHMLEIIRQEIVENLNIHVWITNHFFIPNSQFDNYVIIESKNGFSSARKIGAGELLNLEQYTEKQAITA